MPVTTRYVCAGQSHEGRVRRNNEDRILVDAERGIFMVVDGLGGHNAGERAAELAVELITARLARQTGTVEERIREAITLANNEILKLSQEEPDLRGMACVLTLVVMDDRDVVVGHVGDSRLYELRPGSIRKITHDQSPVGELEDNRMLSETEAMRHPRRNEVYRDVGSDVRSPDDLDWVELHRFVLRNDAALLLCSDGLSDQVSSADIQTIVERFAGSPEQAVMELIAAANQAGGKDNVSVVLIQAPQYAKTVSVVRNTSQNLPVFDVTEYSFWRKLLLFAGGLLAGLLLFAILRPYWEVSAAGQRLRFGAVRVPATFNVGASQPYTSIQVALQHAAPGDTLVVAPGVYNEAIHMKPGVRIISRQRHGAVLQGMDTLISADGVQSGSVEGFRLEGAASGSAYGVVLKDSSVNVLDLRISGMHAAGVSIRGNSASTVRACRIADHSGAAVSVSGGARPEIANNVLAAGRGSNSPAVEVTGGARPVIVDNIIIEGASEPVWASLPFAAGDMTQTNVFVPMTKNPAKRKIRVLPRE